MSRVEDRFADLLDKIGDAHEKSGVRWRPHNGDFRFTVRCRYCWGGGGNNRPSFKIKGTDMSDVLRQWSAHVGTAEHKQAKSRHVRVWTPDSFPVNTSR